MQRALILFWVAFGLAARGAELDLGFGGVAAGQTPTNFSSALAGGGAPGDWKVLEEETPAAFTPLMPLGTPTPSAFRRHVLAQLSQDPTDERFPMLVYDGQVFKNFKLTAQFKIVSGTAEQMAGIVFRYQNASNFYVVRASALGQNVRFYKVVNGIRGNILGPDLAVTTNAWHTLSVMCEGDQITFWYDDRLAMPPLQDTTFASGKIGFWTKSDAVAYFGPLTVNYTPIVPEAQTLVDGIMTKYPRILGLRIYAPDTNGQMRVIASKNKLEIGMAGTDAETKAYTNGAIFYGHGRGTVAVTEPLNDRNGDPMAAVHVQLKSYSLAETRDMVLARVRIIVNEMEKRVTSKEDLMQ